MTRDKSLNLHEQKIHLINNNRKNYKESFNMVRGIISGHRGVYFASC